MNFFKRIFTRKPINEVNLKKLPKRAKRHPVNLLINEAIKCGYDVLKVDYNNGLIRFKKQGVTVNLYSTTLTITTEIWHPKKGKTQLHRKGLRVHEIIDILKNPRKHTGKGYYKK